MSNEGSASKSGSSTTSSSQLSFFQDNFIDLTLLDSPASTFVRSGTVVRRATIPFRKIRTESTSSTEDDESISNENYRQDPKYRHSLAAINERRSARNSISNESAKIIHRTFSSMDNTSDMTNYGTRSDHQRADIFTTSPTSSSYLSWIESTNSEYFGSAISNASAQDVDSKVGEWNNFWLNYSNPRQRHLSPEHTFSSNGANGSVDDQSEERKTEEGSTQRDITDKNSMDCVMLTMEEFQETLRCSQRITDILQKAMKRSEIDESSNESYYSQQVSGKNSEQDHQDDTPSSNVNRERSVSCVDPPTLQRQKQNLLNQAQQSSSTSCINAILNTGVADIFKRVISKRREVIISDTESRSATRSSFSEWSTN